MEAINGFLSLDPFIRATYIVASLAAFIEFMKFKGAFDFSFVLLNKQYTGRDFIPIYLVLATIVTNVCSEYLSAYFLIKMSPDFISCLLYGAVVSFSSSGLYRQYKMYTTK